MKEINIEDIIEINKEYIIYRNSEGGEECIDLSVCIEEYRKINPDINPSANCVGERAFPIYRLFAPEEIRLFVYLKPFNKLQKFMDSVLDWNFRSKEFAVFYSVQKRLNENGRTTLDLT